ncbi:hypothetical protein MMC15_004209 [Xylographa vitiligo]|nr:hypothetical protein [Xylographa vitiligo]
MDAGYEAFAARGIHTKSNGPRVGFQLSRYPMWRFRVTLGAPPSGASCLAEQLKKQRGAVQGPPVSDAQSNHHRHKLKYHADPLVAILKTIPDAWTPFARAVIG